MAGGKLSARQKMINLMYLVFIAMLAMNMSKEVLSAFGFMNKKLETANVKATATNSAAYATLAEKAAEQAKQYGEAKVKTDKIKTLSDDLYGYIETLKNDLKGHVENPLDYESMDKTDPLDEIFFKDGKHSERGKEFVSKINTYRDSVGSTLAGSDLAKTVADRFYTGKETNKEGRKVDWLEYHYEGFPMVASITNLTQMQADIKATEADALSTLLQGELIKSVSMTNYDAMVVFEKNAYYSGERLSGKIILGKNDPNLTAEKVVLNGRTMPKEKIKAGQVILDGPAGSVGDHTLKGSFFFKEGDSLVEIPIKGGYAVIPKPNEAVISADKMNVVYRGVSNPMTISIPGIPSNKVTASASGLRRKSGSSYVMNPGSGTEVSIRVSGKLPDGTPVSSTKKFRIKDIPKPFGSIRGETGLVKMPKASLAKTSVGVVLEGFVFDLKLTTTGFSLKVPGQATVKVSGSRMNAQAKSVINKAKRGDVIAIFDIKSTLQGGGGYRIKTAAPVNVEIR